MELCYNVVVAVAENHTKKGVATREKSKNYIPFLFIENKTTIQLCGTGDAVSSFPSQKSQRNSCDNLLVSGFCFD